MNTIIWLIIWAYVWFVLWKEVYYFFSTTKNPRFNDLSQKKDILKKLNDLLKEKKFVSKDFYPWIESLDKLPLYSDIIHDVIEYFIEAIEEWNKKEEYFQNIVTYWLWKYEEIYLEIDTEDRERICDYFDQLLNIVWINSSKWKINKFNRPGFIKILYLRYFNNKN